MARVPMIAGNWKMYKTKAEATEFTNQLQTLLDSQVPVEVVVCPPFTALSAVREKVYGSKIKLGAQNMFWADRGAFTGEISPQMLVDLNCSYVILGHSERRTLLNETDELIAKKVKSALEYGPLPIICVGENFIEWQEGQTGTKVKAQVEAALELLDAREAAQVTIAYEPIWAIGTGKTASAQDATLVAKLIRETVAELYDTKVSEEIRVLYGGSVKAENIAQFMQNPVLDGALVGGASLEAASFANIIHEAAKVAGRR